MRTPAPSILLALALAACAPSAMLRDGGAAHEIDDTGTDAARCTPRDAGSALAVQPDAAVAFPDRDLTTTVLSLDLAALHGSARIELVPSDAVSGVSLEIGALTIDGVTGDAGVLAYVAHEGQLDVTLPAGVSRFTVAYDFPARGVTAFDGWMPAASSRGVSFLWTRFCGNLFPCHSDPADGVQISISITGLPAGAVAVYPATATFDAPSYMTGIAVDDRFVFHDLGVTRAGTHVGLYAFDADAPAALAGTAHLRDAFEFYETLLGPYRYGDHVASVEADWGANAYGGMEHHPYWHVSSAQLEDPVTHVHEAAHGWFGNAIRLRCWEDFVLSEGTVSYLAARAIEATEGVAASDAVWAQYESTLARAVATHDVPAYPATCGAIDLVHDPLWSDIPYMKGAFFYRAVEQRIGRATLDAALAAFYVAHAGRATTMQEMLDALEAASCVDLGDLESTWLRGLGDPLRT